MVESNLKELLLPQVISDSLKAIENNNSLNDSQNQNQTLKSTKNAQSIILGQLEKGDFGNEIKAINQKLKLFHPEEISNPFSYKFILTKDRKYIISGQNDGKIDIIDLESKTTKTQIIGNDVINCLAIDSSDSYLYIPAQDGHIKKIIQWNNFSEVADWEAHKGTIKALKISNDDKWIFSCGEDGKIIKNNAETGELGGILYLHEGSANCLDISADDGFLVSGGNDRFIKIFDLLAGKVEAVLEPMNKSVWCVKISNKKIIAGGSLDGEIRLWEWGTWDVKQSLIGHKKACTSIQFLKGEDYLLSGSNDGSIRIWNILTGSSEITLKNHRKEVIDICVSSNKMYSIGKDNKLLIWSLQKTNELSRIKAHDGEILKLAYSEKHSALFSMGRDNKIIGWNSSDFTKIYEFSIKKWALFMCLAPDEDYLVSASKDRSIIFIDIADGSTIVHNLDDKSCVTTLLFSENGKYLITGDDKCKVKVSKYKSPQKIKFKSEYSSHIHSISSLAITSNNTLLFSGSQSGDIWVHDLHQKTNIAELNGHSETVSKMKVSRDSKHLISISYDKSIRIWNIEKKFCARVINHHLERIYDLYLSKDGQVFYTRSLDSTIAIWSYESFSLITSFEFLQGGRALEASADEKLLYIAEGEEITCKKSPLSIGIGLYGPGKNYYSFLGYIKSILRGDKPKHVPILDKWVIMPYKINALHLYAYFNMPKHLKEAICKGSASFYETSQGKSPISLCLERNFTDCVNSILNSCKKKIQENPYEIALISKDIVKLNLRGFSGLHNFYKCIFYPSKAEYLPKFCIESSSLPILHLSTCLSVVPASFLKEEQFSNDGQSIVFLESAIYLNTIAGSAESLEFLNSLVESKNSEILRTDFINEFIKQKWKKIWPILCLQGFIYALFLIFLCVHLLFYLKDGTMLAPLFVTNFFLLLYEIYQMGVSGSSYLSDLWNYWDVARCLLTIFYLYVEWGEPTDEGINTLSTFLFLVSCIRGVAYFRLLQETRYMIELLQEVILDIRPFIFLYIYTTFCFGMIVTLLTNEHSGLFYVFLGTSHFYNYNNFQSSDFFPFEYVLMLIVGLINPIIMANLLISIIGDTYDRVQEGITIADRKELVRLIIEGETLMFWRRGRTAKYFMQMCLAGEKEDEDDGWLGKVREITLKINRLALNIEENFENNEKTLTQSIKINEKMNEKINQMNSRMMNIEKLLMKNQN